MKRPRSSLSRQGTPTLPGSSAEKVLKGAYTVAEVGNGAPGLILASSGTEVALAIDTAEALVKEGGMPAVHVVSMPCWELF